MNEIIVELMKIRSMILSNPEQPIKNCQGIVDGILKNIDEEDTGFPVDLEAG